MAFVKIDRQMFEHWLWTEKPFDKGRAWLDLIQLASHKDEKFMANGVMIDGKRGHIYKSQDYLAKRWGWSRGKVSRFLGTLEKDNMIIKKNVRYGAVNGTVITLVNYGKFQDARAVDGAVNGQSTDSGRTVNGHIQESIKESIKESKKEYIEPSAEPDCEEDDGVEWVDPTTMTKEEFMARMKGKGK